MDLKSIKAYEDANDHMRQAEGVGGSGVPPCTSFCPLGNAYFFVDAQDRVVTSNGPRTIITLRESGTMTAPTLDPVPDRSYDLSPAIAADDRLAGILPDWHGRIWYATAGKGDGGPRVGVIDPATWPETKWVQLDSGEEISNGLAVTRTGTFVLTSKALYKLEAGQDDQPHVLWKASYDTSDTVKPGQLSLGSGTSPTVFGEGKFVAINDSATPMKVVVFRTATTLKPGETRLVGAMPVFENMEGQACADSLLGYRDSIIVENNYGYAAYFDKNGNGASVPNLPGLERIDVSADGKSLHKVWVNTEVASNAVPKLSTTTGLIYVIDRQKDHTTGADVYYWTALDFRTGQTVWQKMAGRGINWDSYWAAPALGPDGTHTSATTGGSRHYATGK